MTDKNNNTVDVKVVDQEKDVVIICQEDLKFDQFISYVVNKSSKVLGLIKRTFTFMGKTIFLCLYKLLVRSHLDYRGLARLVSCSEETYTYG